VYESIARQHVNEVADISNYAEIWYSEVCVEGILLALGRKSKDLGWKTMPCAFGIKG
jgi:hypothetical protein